VKCLITLNNLINYLKIKFSDAYTAIVESEPAINSAGCHVFHAFKKLIKQLKCLQASCKENCELVQKLRSE
jgi:hypothetical protein